MSQLAGDQKPCERRSSKVVTQVHPKALVSSEKGGGSIQERAEAIVMQCNNVDLDFGFFVYIMPVGDNGVVVQAINNKGIKKRNKNNNTL